MNKLKKGVIELAHRVDRKVGWHRLPVPLALPVLAAMRERLRERNLYDTGQPTNLPVPETNGEAEPRYLTARTIDGTFTDLDDPLMGSAGTRFGCGRTAAATGQCVVASSARVRAITRAADRLRHCRHSHYRYRSHESGRRCVAASNKY